MSTKTIDKRCGNCGNLVVDPAQDPPQGCWDETNGNRIWIEVHDDILDTYGCDDWTPKETDDDANDLDVAAGGTVADNDEPESADELQGETEQSGITENEAATDSEPVAIDDAGTTPSYDELLQEVLSLRKQTEQDSSYKKRLTEIRSQINDAKDYKSRWDKKIKVLQEEIGEVIEEMEKNVYDPAKYPLIEKSEKKPQSEPAATETVDPDAWKSVPAKEHFVFTDKEWELMAPSEGVADNMTVGDLEAFRVRLANGEKVKGFGEAKSQKLDDQMEEFWSKHPQFCFDNAPQTEDDDLDPSDVFDDEDDDLDPSDVFDDEDDEDEDVDDENDFDEDDEELDESDEDGDEF